MLKVLPFAAAVALSAHSSSNVAERQQAFQRTAVGGQVIDLTLEEGLHQRVLYEAPARPRGTLVMLPGGTGDLGVEGNGDLRHGDNFVVRTRADWVARGYAVLIPDTIDDTNLRGKRSSAAYARLVEALAGYARSRAKGSVFLIGTSQGTIAAMNGAAHARPGLIAGLVLTESVSLAGRLSTETVFDADPPDVSVPALVVANSDDRCNVAPPSMAPRIVKAMTRSPSARLVMVSGGMQRSEKACGSLSPHGYYGIEAQVIDVISKWLRAHGG